MAYDKYKDSGIECIGKIPEEWKVLSFKLLLKDTNAGEVIPKEFWGSGKELLYTCQKTPEKSTFKDFPASKKTEKGDLLLTRNGTPYIHIPIVNSIYSNVVQRIKLIEQVDFMFLKYYLDYASKTLKGNGDIIESFNMDVWKNIKVSLPSHSEQQAIANFLDYKIEKIDKIIAKKKELIEKLKEKREIMISEAVTKGLDKNVKMKDSGIEWIGEIPEGWSMHSIKLIAQIKGRIGFRGYTTNDLVEEGPYVVGATHINKRGLIDLSKPVFISEYKYEESPEIKLHGGEILMVKVGAVGRIGMVSEGIGKATINPNVMILRNIKGCSKYLFYVLSNNILQEEMLLESSKSGVQPAINQSYIQNIKIPYPSICEQKKITEYIENNIQYMYDLIDKLNEQIRNLEEYKQILIFNAVTGKIGVRNFQKEV